MLTHEIDSLSVPPKVTAGGISVLTDAALDTNHVTGWTHNFYRYPARFSPRFAAATIECFSRPFDLILDPYMGGGTAVVEGMAAGRNVIGNDINSLAKFIAKVKITALTELETAVIKRWAKREVPKFSYYQSFEKLSAFIDPQKTRNLSLVRARFIKKAVAAALASIAGLPTVNAQDFAKCIVLRVAQWALDGRRQHTPLVDFRARLSSIAEEMLGSIRRFGDQTRLAGSCATILNVDAALIDQSPPFRDGTQKVSLVVTSPPYPGVHVLYHRWQVDGRRETPAPYWIAGCNDGQGNLFYNFGDQREGSADRYFQKSLLTLRAIRRTMRKDGHVVQLLAFNRPDELLPRYLRNMEDAGFQEAHSHSRIWRHVPNRKWHATMIGLTHSSNEVVLIHRAV